MINYIQTIHYRKYMLEKHTILEKNTQKHTKHLWRQSQKIRTHQPKNFYSSAIY